MISIGSVLHSCSNKSKSEAAEFFERGNYHFKKREYERAIELFTEAIEKVPDFADAYNNRGLCFEKTEQFERARADYQQAVDLDDSFSQAKLNLARVLIHNSETEKSGLLIADIEQEYRDSSSFFDYRGQWYLLKNQIDAAINDFSHAIDLGGESAELFTNLGFAYYQKKDFPNARDYFLKALSINPQFGYALNNLSASYGHSNEWYKALEYSKKAVDTNPTELSFINTHTLNLLETNDLKKAKEMLEKGLKRSPTDPYVMRNKAIFLIKSESIKEGHNYLVQIEKTNPEVEYLYFYLGISSNSKPVACSFFKRGASLGDRRSQTELESCERIF